MCHGLRWMLGVVGVVTCAAVIGGVTASAQWQLTNTDGFGVDANSTWEMVLFNDVVYAGTESPGAVYRLGNPTDPTMFWWREVSLPTTIPGMAGTFRIDAVRSMAVFAAAGARWPSLYVAVSGEDTGNRRSKCVVLRTENGVSWSASGDTWDIADQGEIQDMIVFDGRLYATMGDTQRLHPEYARVLRTSTDGLRWEVAVPGGSLALGAGDFYFGTLEVFGGALYAGTSGFNEVDVHDPTHTSEIWRTTNGTSWTRVGELSSPTMAEVESMAVFRNHLYVGTKNHPPTPEAAAGPELWRTSDGTTWERLDTRWEFDRDALHVDVLVAYPDEEGALYAGLGSPYAHLYRSVDGETWTAITPPEIRDHPEHGNYLVGALLGAGEYVFMATGFNNIAGRGTQVWRLSSLRTDVGPCLATHDGEPVLFHRIPDPEENVAETVYRDHALLALEPVHDENVYRSSAFTDTQPAAYGYSHCGMVLCDRYLQLVYTGHNNDGVWVTQKRSPGRGWFWDTPVSIPGAATRCAPGATAYDWAGVTGPQLTVAYTDRDSQRIRLRVRQGDAWSRAYDLPAAAVTANGPEIVSFDGDLYVFYRGAGSDNALYVAKKTSSRLSDGSWGISGLPRAFTRASNADRAVTSAVVDGRLVVAYVGHNNDYVWLRATRDGVTWDRLGYVDHVLTEHTPALTVHGDTLYLAFTAAGGTEICFGTLEIDFDNPHDTPGHRWQSLRPIGTSCCSNCILRIMDVIFPELMVPTPEPED
ncbi:MAG: hypothetical protein JXB13_05390 [Phycisphaerae bacterium]|nr:hypothetical protein [Phycisphaerae bacterium]